MVHSQLEIFRAKILVYRTLFRTWARVKKYFWFIAALKAYKLFTLLTFEPAKGKLLEAFYLVNRYIDDVADADAMPDWTIGQRLDYIRRKRHFTLHPTGPKDSLEFLILYYQKLARKRGEDFTSEAIFIIDSMIFDAERLNSGRIYERDILESNYHLLDEAGTIRPMLRLVNEKVERFSDLSALAKAVRTYYNLRDLKSDLAKGLINIPQEDIDSFHIDFQLDGDSQNNLRKWFRHQSAEGLKLLDLHRETLERKPFRRFTQFVLRQVYERKTRSFLKLAASQPHI